jgi:hypothetical protein
LTVVRPIIKRSPLVVTPPYPDHTCGYNCVTGAMMHAAQQYFGRPWTNLTVQNLATGAIRNYDRFGDVYEDTIDARVYLGIHFRSADEQAAKLGRHVAEWVAGHFFGPTS